MTSPPNSLPPLIPREILFGNPAKENPQISPDGKRLAYLAPVDGVLNVWVGVIGGDRYRPVTRDSDRGVRIYFWGYDNDTILYLQDMCGDENWRLYSANVTSASTKELTPFANVQVQILAYEKRFPDEMVIGMNKEDPSKHDAYRLNLQTSELRLVATNPGNVTGWVTDPHLAVRGAVSATPDGGFDLLVRDTEQADWHTVVTWDADDGLNSGPVGFTGDGSGMYLADSREHNATRLVRFDIATGQTDILAQDPDYDAGRTMIHPDTYEVQAVGFVRSRLEWTVLDAAVRSDFAAIAKINSGDFAVTDRTVADDIWLVGFTQDIGPVSYYIFDRGEKSAQFLFYNRPELAASTLAPMEPVSFSSRDGITIHGYLTRPVGAPPEPLPMVLNVHGGPWHRDTWGYDSEAQWLANRGYATLQINFRGSTGYGKKFVNLGDREWGGRMHDDLVDAVHWAIDRNIADPARVAIYGGSYGGYAALVGATFTPELFCCAVDVVGPSNLLTFINTVPPYWSAFLEMLYRRVGHPERDQEFLRDRSPLFHVDEIKIPILIAQGANDPRVKQDESEQIVAAMQQKGIDHEYILFSDEGHGFAKPDNNLKFHASAERFLAKYLGGRYEE